MTQSYETDQTERGQVRRFTKGVPVSDAAKAQLMRTAEMGIVHPFVAAMPDVHVGKGATIGSVIPTLGAIIPAAVGVDLGCGMMAVKTTLQAKRLPDDLKRVRTALEQAVPHGQISSKVARRGAWADLPATTVDAWQDDLEGPSLEDRFAQISEKYRIIRKANHVVHLGTLGGGNHFVELCIDENQEVWVMLHSGSRGVGNRIGSYFIELAKKDMGIHLKNLPDENLAYLQEGSDHFGDYFAAVSFAQDFARTNREVMMQNVLRALKKTPSIAKFKVTDVVVDCHHNYVQKEKHFGQDVYVTRKGAVSARSGEMGIVPGSMGAKSFIVRGLGNADSLHSCSHGAGRLMSRSEAKKTFTLKDHRLSTQGVECRKDRDVIDETPGAYKDIDAVMLAQKDLVEVVHTLKQVVCIKG